MTKKNLRNFTVVHKKKKNQEKMNKTLKKIIK